LLAEGIAFAAEVFAGVDDKRVKFIEELGVAGKLGFEQCADLFVTLAEGKARGGGRIGWDKSVAFENAAGIGVHDEDRVTAGVEEDGVSRFGADTAESEELLAENICGYSEEPRRRKASAFGANWRFARGAWRETLFGLRRCVSRRAGRSGIEEVDEGFEGFGLLAEVPGGPEMFGKDGW